MIRYIFDLKIGTGEDFYLVSKNERIDTDCGEDCEAEDEEWESLSSASQENLVKYMTGMLDGELAYDYIEEAFSESLLRDERFASKVDILEVSNVRVKRISKAKTSGSLKAAEVMKLLNITRPTLCKYVKEGKIKTDACVNGQYKYNKDSVYALINAK